MARLQIPFSAISSRTQSRSPWRAASASFTATSTSPVASSSLPLPNPRRSVRLHEFTGERVIPGLVDADLFNEHLSRYRFAAQFATSEMAVLDAGCGTGYGSAEFKVRTIAGIDLSPEAVAYAVAHYARPGVFFAAGSCAALPFADAVFDLLVSFEVIEHLPDYRTLLSEACRVLKRGGVFLVSTPN